MSSVARRNFGDPNPPVANCTKADQVNEAAGSVGMGNAT